MRCGEEVRRKNEHQPHARKGLYHLSMPRKGSAKAFSNPGF
jgi:hypothetical protein